MISSSLKSRVSVLIAGVVSTFGKPEFYGVVFLILGIGWFYEKLTSLSKAQKKESLIYSFLFGFGYSFGWLYYLYSPTLVNFPRFLVLLPFSVTLVPSYLALYFTFVFSIYFILSNFITMKFLKVFLFSICWVLCEWLIGNVLIDFPWVIAGYRWAFRPEPIQIVAYTGIYSLSFVTVFCGALLGSSRKHIVRNVSLVLLVISVMCSFGYFRLDENKTEYTDSYVRLVQGNISQETKWSKEYVRENTGLYMRLSAQQSKHHISMVIWPEAAVAYHIRSFTDPTLVFLSSCLPNKNSALMTGCLWNNIGITHNSAIVINNAGDVLCRYDKVRLLPFGEYVPLSNFFAVQSITQHLNFSQLFPGYGKTDVLIDNFPKSRVLICSESMFPTTMAESDGCDAIINISNDAWFGNSSEMYQHAAVCRIRAVESGLPVLRVSNTGVTCVFDPVGREIAKIDVCKPGVLDCFVPKPISKSANYVLFGNLLFLKYMIYVFVFCIILLCTCAAVKKINSKYSIKTKAFDIFLINT